MTARTLFAPPMLKFARKARRSVAVDMNADMTWRRSTGDPRLDLALADNRARQR